MKATRKKMYKLWLDSKGFYILNPASYEQPIDAVLLARSSSRIKLRQFLNGHRAGIKYTNKSIENA